MDTGVISSRYAEALLRYVSETGGGEAVCAQVMKLEKALKDVPELRKVMEDPKAVSAREKLSLFESALDGESMAPELSKFISLVLDKGRIDHIRIIFHSFVAKYNAQKGVRYAHLKTAVEPSEELLERLKALVKKETGLDAIIRVTVDPSLIGGFVFDIDDYMIDASVSRQLELIRRQFIEKNRRIV